MARKDEQKMESAHGHNRIQGFVFGISLEGSEEIVSEGIKAFADAMAKGGIALAPVSGARSSLSGPKPGACPMAEAQERALGGLEEEIESSAKGDSPLEDTKRARRRATRTPKFLNDLDLKAASVHLSDFVKKKSPSGDGERYAVIMAWFKQHLKISEIGIDHIFTAYKILGWQGQLPADVGQAFRNLKSNKKWVEAGSKSGLYRLNSSGENSVNKLGGDEK
jgi:hypothetical protein